jgi:CDP-diacylglycerol--glycerol-3-phosphate 3-phosphatidyltransferase
MRSDLLFLAAAVGSALATMPLYARGSAPRQPNRSDSPVRGSFVLGSFLRSWFYWFVGPVERWSLARGLTPLFYNFVGVAFGLASLGLFASGRLTAGGWAILLGGTADVLDGRIARARGVASPRGAFLDSTLDRFAEMAVFVGLAAFYRMSGLGLLLVVLGLGGSLLVSYTRARGESQGVLCNLGIMQRAERLLLLGFGSILDPALSAGFGRSPGAFLLIILAVIAAGTLGTAVFRTLWIARRLPTKD